jgi:hypothetical protein
MDQCLSVNEITSGSFTTSNGDTACFVLDSFAMDRRFTNRITVHGHRVVSHDTYDMSQSVRSWSPRKKWCVSWTKGQKHCVIVHENGTHRVMTDLLHWPPMCTLGAPRWSPDERRVAFVAMRVKDAGSTWNGDGLGEGFGVTTEMPEVWVLDVEKACVESWVTTDTSAENYTRFPAHVCLSDSELFWVELQLSSVEPSGLIYCGNRQSRIMRQSGCTDKATCLSRAEGFGINSLTLVATLGLLIWVQSKSQAMHRSPESICGISIGPTATRPLEYVSDVCDINMSVAGELLWYTAVRGCYRVLCKLDLNSGDVVQVPSQLHGSFKLLDVCQSNGSWFVAIYFSRCVYHCLITLIFP